MTATACSIAGRHRILLVDDIELNRVLTEAVLRGATYDVDSVGDGEAALAAVESRSYDLVLMDLDLPGRDGHESTVAIRQKQSRVIKVAALSSHTNERARARSREVGMSAHIGRPIAPRDLLREVDRVLREPAAGSQPDTWDLARYKEWVEKLGADRMRGVLGTLLDQFRVLLALLEEPAEQAGDALHRRAHDVASTSGMLGFAEVTRRCRSVLEANDASAEAEARSALADVLTRSASRLDAYLLQEKSAAEPKRVV